VSSWFHLPDTWRVEPGSGNDATYYDPDGATRVHLAVRLTDDLRPLAAGEEERHRRTLANGCTYRYSQQGPVRRWDVAQPAGDRVRLFTFTYQCAGSGWASAPHLDLLFQQIPEMVPST